MCGDENLMLGKHYKKNNRERENYYDIEDLTLVVFSNKRQLFKIVTHHL